MVRIYRDSTSPRVQPVAVEKRDERIVPGVPVPLLGFVDILTDSSIIDTKTSKQKKTSLKPDWRLQARIYQLFVPRHVQFHVITKAKEPTVWTPLDSPQLAELWDTERAEHTKRHVRQLARSRTTSWRPTETTRGRRPGSATTGPATGAATAPPAPPGRAIGSQRDESLAALGGRARAKHRPVDVARSSSLPRPGPDCATRSTQCSPASTSSARCTMSGWSASTK